MKFYLILILTSQILFSGQIKEIAIEHIHKFFGDEINISSHKFSIPISVKSQIQNTVKQSFFRDNVYYWQIKANDNLYFAVMDNVIGKSMPITFLTIFDFKGKVLNSSIIKYREGYGGEVSGKAWLSQFNGMTNDSLYNYPRHISGISGATISVKSVTKGISKLSLLFSEIIREHNE